MRALTRRALLPKCRDVASARREIEGRPLLESDVNVELVADARDGFDTVSGGVINIEGALFSDILRQVCQGDVELILEKCC
jgi:hypothetical protein